MGLGGVDEECLTRQSQNHRVKFSGLGNFALPTVRILTLSAYLQLPLD